MAKRPRNPEYLREAHNAKLIEENKSLRAENVHLRERLDEVRTRRFDRIAAMHEECGTLHDLLAALLRDNKDLRNALETLENEYTKLIAGESPKKMKNS